MATPTVRARRLGLALRQLREAAALTLDDAADEVDMTKSTISRIEHGQTIARPGIVRALLNLYGVTGADHAGLMQLARDARTPGWWRAYSDVLPSAHLDYLALESEADTISVYDASVVHGLCQTAEYTRHVMRADVVPPLLSDEEIERRVEVRQNRQARLTGPNRPSVCVIVDEAALSRPVGGPDVMRRQLEHLLKLSDLCNVSVQVAPLAIGAHPALPGLQILEYADPGDPVIVVMDTVSGDMLIDRPADLRRCQAIYSHLRSLALGPHESRRMIRQRLDTT